MANLPETPQWEDGIYQIEVSDPVLGGPDGISNRQGKQLASRTLYLKQQVEKGGSDLEKHIAAADPHTQYAPKASPTFTGTPTAPTQTKTDNSTKLATTAHVKSVVADYAPLSSPALTGKPTAPTAAQTANDTQLANTAFVKAAIAALVASSPEALDTLNKLAAALGNDPNFATTMTNALAGKQPLDNTLTALSGKSVAALLEYLHLEETVKQAAGAIQKSGGNMEGALGLTRTSSFGVATENTLGGNSIAIGDSDSGFKSNGDGNIALMANSVLAGYFSENELQHHEKVLTKIFRAISTGNATEGTGGFGSQLTSGAPFYSPAIVRQNNDNNYFPLWKQIVSLQSGYPVAASMGLLTTGEPNFPQIVLHAKTDFEVNDKLWVFDVATGELRSPALIRAGGAVLNTDGDVSGSAWGGALTNWLNSQLATRDANINARATVDWVNSNFNKKNTATLGFSGWSRDESTGLIMQWGNVDNAKGTYSFPRAFNDTCFAVFATNKDGQGGAIDNAYGYPVSKTQFYLASKANSGADTAYGISWFALGY
ncbi:gp53-like domain-containing protein [Enterobacter hormaechei]|uniref:gp53-like domain-containing protein n=2 Tax=Enterobacter hormaechei TaxID=158836 RepID=UPI00406A80A4